MPLLSIQDLRCGYGEVEVLHGVSLRVDEGEAVAIIGANGAGKTTLLRAISGMVKVTAGAIDLDGRDLTAVSAHSVPKLGVAHVPQARELFPRLTVRENLILGAYLRRDREERRGLMEHVMALFPRLSERIGQMAGTLSGGEQQMLAIGRALMLRPRLIMLDEPSQGLAPRVVGEVYERLAAIHAEGTSVLLVEQNVRAALEFVDRAYVLERGATTLEGDAATLADDDEIRRAYLGV